MRHRRVLYLALPVVLLATYFGSFLVIVDIVHVTYGPGPGPQPPQFVMYASDSSDQANVIAHWIFLPIIAAYEYTGDYGFLDEPPHLGL